MKKQSNFFVFALALLLSVFTACSTATDEVGYGEWDEDSNALLDDREYGNAWNDSGYYDRWDVNNDDYIDEDEWNTGRESYLGEYNGAFGDWDADADSRLSEDEFRGGVFGYYDRDRDNMINEEEYNYWNTDMGD